MTDMKKLMEDLMRGKPIKQDDDLPDYVRGAVMAYNDCAAFTDQMLAGLPADVKHIVAGGLQVLSEGFRNKALLAVNVYRQSITQRGGNA